MRQLLLGRKIVVAVVLGWCCGTGSIGAEGTGGAPLPPGNGVNATEPNGCVQNQTVENPDGSTTVICVTGGGGGLSPLDPGSGGPGTGPTAPGSGGGTPPPPPGTPLGGALLAQVQSSASLAKAKLANSRCAALFSGFTPPFNDGLFILNQWVLGFRNGEPCPTGAAADTQISANPQTTIHARYILICNAFQSSGNPGLGSVTIIHEALHVAGLRRTRRTHPR